MTPNGEARDALAALQDAVERQVWVTRLGSELAELIHGCPHIDDADSRPAGAWLANELEKRGLLAHAPALPHATTAGLRAWIAALPDDACRQVVNAWRDAYARAFTDSHPAGMDGQHAAGCAAVRDALLSLAPKEEAKP